MDKLIILTSLCPPLQFSLVCNNFSFELPPSIGFHGTDAVLGEKDISAVASVGPKNFKKWRKDYKTVNQAAKYGNIYNYLN